MDCHQTRPLSAKWYRHQAFKRVIVGPLSFLIITQVNTYYQVLTPKKPLAQSHYLGVSEMKYRGLFKEA